MRMALILALASLAARAEPFPGGQADANRAYLANPSGGVDAVDLAEGKTEWTLPGAHPLALDARQLGVWLLVPGHPVATRNCRLKIQLVDLATGQARRTSPEVALPDWVNPLAHGDGCDFILVGRLQGSRLEASWTAHTWYNGGAAPPPEVEKAARHSGQGSFAVDCATGQLLESTTTITPEPAPTAVTRAPRHYFVRQLPAKGFTIPRELVCQELDGGKQLWTHPVSPAYRPIHRP